jgi:hypothetical protein
LTLIKRNIIIHCVLPLILGALVYAVFRKDSIFYFKNNLFHTNNFILQFIRYHFSDALWAYSLTSALIVLTSISYKILITISLLFFLSMEWFTAAYFNQIFDWADVIIMSFSCVIAFIICKRN